MEGLATIFARNCSVRRIDKSTAAVFLERYHRMGDTGSRYRYGLFVNRSTGAAERHLPEGTLVAVATFSNARRWDKEGRRISSYEWIRYASLPDITVAGGMGKLMNTFIEEVHPDDIMTYVDTEWSDGEVYRILGFVDEEVVERNGFKNLKFRKKITY